MSTDIPMGDRKIAQLLQNPLSEAGIALSGLSTPSVKVLTGSEARPAGNIVFWVGGTERPTNMGESDVWFSLTSVVGEVADTVAPTVPGSLSASNVGANSFDLSWTPSTDNEAVSLYEIYLDGTLKATSPTSSASLTGLVASTAYSVTVRAKDAAGNLSAPSSALSVTTSVVSGSPRHSIWGSNPYPYTVNKATESNPITVANSFYSYGTSPDVSAWRVVGAKIWIPAGITVSQPSTVKAWFGQDTKLDATPVQQVTISTWVSGAWNEVTFPAPIETNAGDFVWVGYTFTNGDYFAAPESEIGNNFVTALDGSHIVLSDNNGSTQMRSQFKLGSSAAAYANPVGYSIDVIYDEGA